MKYLVIFAFVLIIGSLASALFFMMRNDRGNDPQSDRHSDLHSDPQSDPQIGSESNSHGEPQSSLNDTRKSANMVRALALRVGFSIILFLCILIAWKMGYIQPTGIPAGA